MCHLPQKEQEKCYRVPFGPLLGAGSEEALILLSPPLCYVQGFVYGQKERTPLHTSKAKILLLIQICRVCDL